MRHGQFLKRSSKLVTAVASLLAVAWVASVHVQAGPQQGSLKASQAALSDRALLDKYCVTCHNPRVKAGNLTLNAFDPTKAADSPEVWEKVIRKLRGGVMPPMGAPRPDEARLRALREAVEGQLDRAGAVNPNPGRTVSLHRLNRVEYQNAVRDLLTVEMDITSLLPPDDASYGFDNIGGVLKLSESLLERYMSTSRRISRVAMASPPPAVVDDIFEVPALLSQNRPFEGLPLGTRGGTIVHYNFPQDAEYEFRVAFWCNQESEVTCSEMRGYNQRHDLELSIDGQRVHLFTIEPRPASTTPDPNWDPSVWQVRVPVKAGLRDVAATFLKLPSWEPQERARVHFETPDYEGARTVTGLGVYQPYLRSLTIGGPYQSAGASDTASRRAILVCQPVNEAEEAPCAQKILSKLARTAYRRPVTDADVQGLMGFYTAGRREGGFEAGIESAVGALLVGPHFLFRIEEDPVRAAGAKPANYPVSDVELASRLSFFLWSSIPDEELLTAATSGELRKPAVLEQQVQRMIADPKAEALGKNFMPQWLGLRRGEAVHPHHRLFPNFDESLREAFNRETELFFDSMLQEDRNVLEFLTADYTFVNERLAKHYGIPHIQGGHFQRVMVDPRSGRGGLLGQGTMLLATSQDTRTSPVVRGKWILDNILGAPPPEPPPNVPSLPAGRADYIDKDRQSMRERMAVHRRNPTCAGCHSMIDPVGFALEGFDAIGKARTADESDLPIDASGLLPDGTNFGSFGEFRAALVRHPERFVTTLTERLMTYALGRGLEYYDMPAVRAIVRDAESKDYPFSSLILGVVKSLPFQNRRSAS